MITEFIEKWDKYKNELEEYFKTNKQLEYSSYKLIVKALFDIIINKDEEDKFNTENIVVIDDGDYQGTQIFIYANFQVLMVNLNLLKMVLWKVQIC